MRLFPTKVQLTLVCWEIPIPYQSSCHELLARTSSMVILRWPVNNCIWTHLCRALDSPRIPKLLHQICSVLCCVTVSSFIPLFISFLLASSSWQCIALICRESCDYQIWRICSLFHAWTSTSFNLDELFWGWYKSVGINVFVVRENLLHMICILNFSQQNGVGASFVIQLIGLR